MSSSVPFERYFEEVKTATSQQADFWSIDLYAPILLVDLQQMLIFANTPDSHGVLQKQGNVYSAKLPSDLMIANTAVEWSGKRWAMAILPLPAHKKERLDLLSHELFHVAQPELGFELFSPSNAHLDDKNGRIYLRLELTALLKALTDSKTKQKEHLRAALLFRQRRYSLYSAAKTTENQLELNEGIAAYTGLIISGRNPNEVKAHFQTSFKDFLKSPTFVRSFAYQTIPLYGYLLRNTDKKNENWHRQVDVNTNLTHFFMAHFQLGTLDGEVSSECFQAYNGQKITAEEAVRAEKRIQQIETYENGFINNSHVELPLKNISISFNPKNIVPLPGKGTYYPTLTLSDEWGKLNVTKGALINLERNTASLTLPTKIAEGFAEGDGWQLHFSQRYVLEYDKQSTHFYLKKKD